MTRLPARAWLPAIAAAMAGLASALVTPAGRAAEVAVRIGWLRATNDLALARRHGSLERALGELGARVEWAGPFAAAAPALEALNADSIDVSATSSTATATALAAGVPLVVFGYQRLGPHAESIVVRDASPFRSVADLVGRSVAVNRGGTGDYLLARALATAGIDPTRVRRVFLQPGDAGPAFAQGYVDAWAVWDPFLTLALTRFDGRVLADGAAIGSRNAVVLVARESFAAAHRPLLKRLFDALAGENAWALAHRDEAGAVWAETLGLPDALAATLGRNDALPSGPVDAAARGEIAGVAAWFRDAGLIPVLPDIGGHALDLSGPDPGGR